MKQLVNIFWFRRDLRLNDNVGLYKALKEDKPVLPIFILDKTILEKLPKSDARVAFIFETLQQMNTILKEKYNSEISIHYGEPEAIFKSLIDTFSISSVYTNHDYEPYAIARDNKIKEYLEEEHISFKTFKDQVIFETNEIVKKNGTAYKVYTPYSKKWLEKFHTEGLSFFPSENLLDSILKNTVNQTITLKDIGFSEANNKVKPYILTESLIKNYEETRNFPGKDETSKLGTHLRFGTVSIREIEAQASKSQNITFLKELIWREFFMQILWHFPHTVTSSFKPKYDRILWRNNEIEFKAWCEGQTGYPLVDAGMRQLNQTGFMHNRVRMLVGSFLCKHLLIDWRWGETYFSEKLHDYELSSNIGNWQWVAGSGVDAAPYFRIFNPTTQIDKFDKQHNYIKKWVPEYQEFNYPKPIVDHKEARERCLKTYKAAVS